MSAEVNESFDDDEMLNNFSNDMPNNEMKKLTIDYSLVNSSKNSNEESIEQNHDFKASNNITKNVTQVLNNNYQSMPLESDVALLASDLVSSTENNFNDKFEMPGNSYENEIGSSNITLNESKRIIKDNSQINFESNSNYQQNNVKKRKFSENENFLDSNEDLQNLNMKKINQKTENLSPKDNSNEIIDESSGKKDVRSILNDLFIVDEPTSEMVLASDHEEINNNVSKNDTIYASTVGIDENIKNNSDDEYSNEKSNSDFKQDNMKQGLSEEYNCVMVKDSIKNSTLLEDETLNETKLVSFNNMQMPCKSNCEILQENHQIKNNNVLSIENPPHEIIKNDEEILNEKKLISTSVAGSSKDIESNKAFPKISNISSPTKAAQKVHLHDFAIQDQRVIEVSSDSEEEQESAINNNEDDSKEISQPKNYQTEQNFDNCDTLIKENPKNQVKLHKTTKYESDDKMSKKLLKNDSTLLTNKNSPSSYEYSEEESVEKCLQASTQGRNVLPNSSNDSDCEIIDIASDPEELNEEDQGNNIKEQLNEINCSVSNEKRHLAVDHNHDKKNEDLEQDSINESNNESDGDYSDEESNSNDTENPDYEENVAENQDFEENPTENQDFEENALGNQDCEENAKENQDCVENAKENQDCEENATENQDFEENAEDKNCLDIKNASRKDKNCKDVENASHEGKNYINIENATHKVKNCIDVKNAAHEDKNCIDIKNASHEIKNCIDVENASHEDKKCINVENASVASKDYDNSPSNEEMYNPWVHQETQPGNYNFSAPIGEYLEACDNSNQDHKLPRTAMLNKTESSDDDDEDEEEEASFNDRDFMQDATEVPKTNFVNEQTSYSLNNKRVPHCQNLKYYRSKSKQTLSNSNNDGPLNCEEQKQNYSSKLNKRKLMQILIDKKKRNINEQQDSSSSKEDSPSSNEEKLVNIFIKRNSDLRDEVKRLKKDIEEKDEQLSQCQAKISKTQHKLSFTTQQYHKSKEDVKNLKHSLQLQKNQVAELNNELKKYKKERPVNLARYFQQKSMDEPSSPTSFPEGPCPYTVAQYFKLKSNQANQRDEASKGKKNSTANQNSKKK